MNDTTFESLALNPKILDALTDAGYTAPTEIQTIAIPFAIQKRDLLATAQTGTGKTAAFTLPILHLMAEGLNEEGKVNNGKISALILSPTRELAQQIETNLIQYSKNLPFTVASVVGGLPIQKQMKALEKGVDLLVATPGRLLDLMNRKAVNLRAVKYFVLDEADRMLDMGFVHDVRDIARVLKGEIQTLLFSATTSDEIKQLSSVLLKNPEHVAISAPESVAEKIEQKLYFVDTRNKRPLLMELLKDESIERALVFTTTKSNANLLANVLNREGIGADAIHSDKNQKARGDALRSFDDGDIRVLVATDVMARGIDVKNGISHVINFELPDDAESFVHRVGRTARAGSSGVAISFCDINEVSALKSIERFTKLELKVDEDHSYHSPLVETMKNQKTSPFGRRRR